MNEHLGGAYPQGDGNTTMPDVWGYLAVKHQVKSVLDIGCGYGHAMKWFNGFLINVRGVEGWDEAINNHLLKHCVVKHDYNKGPAPLGDERFDLCWCAEFVEHVDERFIPHYMQDMQRCRIVCITHAEPFQNGHHHVTLKDDEWWIYKFANHGFQHLADESALLRETDRWKAGWGRRSLMVFRNPRMDEPNRPFFKTPDPIYFPQP